MADPTVRTAEDDDLARVREVAESSFTASYSMSPNDIETIVEVAFGEEALEARLDDEDAALLVAEADDVLAGVATCEDGEIDWLHVDPERRGFGVGTALFERAREEAGADGSEDEVRASALAANTSSGQFFERFDFERIDERQTEIGDQEVVEYVYAPADAATASETDSDDSERVSDAEEPVRPTERDDLDIPDEVEDDGQQLELGEESIPGSEGGFVITLQDGEEYGYYCVNCESTDVSVDSMDQIRCADCGNTHKPKEEYDASYL